VKNPISDGFGLGGEVERNQDSEQQKPQPCEEAAKVVAGGGEHGVDGLAAGMGKVIAAHAVVFLEVADDGLVAARRLNSRLICGVRRRFWPLV
jgi:hypothetical protein